MNPEQVSACAGIALIYMGPNKTANELVERLGVAMKAGDVDECKAASLLMVAQLMGRGSGDSAPQCIREWSKAFG